MSLSAALFSQMRHDICLLCFGIQEIHIMHLFDADFYGHEMKAVVLGYIRPELDYTSRGALQRLFPNHDQFLHNYPPVLFAPLILSFRLIISC